MSHKGENFAAFTVLLLVAINVAGLGIPVWYNKEHRHSVNATVEKPNCVVHVNVREGLWQRYCIESRVENCELDVQEWCDNLDFPVYNDFVIATEICGDLILLFVFGTIIRSKCRKKSFHLEMVGAEAGLGGLLMMVGVLVYAAADSEIGYQATDLHIGWALCLSAGGIAFLLCIFCICRHVKSIPTMPEGYFPIDDEDDEDELMLMDV
ncbi:uncharacterized protein LOC132727849 [Ruditapes philippinarum]|uniref:uncharacterized protein LOC132727849 n=1 Tax=Ruditapes philippinarum TaxID=129788 RepID=UPI00295B2B41|nr:uncharacterized protein LOC132727849 [Ruditapes philippinarum]